MRLWRWRIVSDILEKMCQLILTISEAIKRIGAIYHLDNQLADLKPDDRRKQRQINLNLWWSFLCVGKRDQGIRPPDQR